MTACSISSCLVTATSMKGTRITRLQRVLMKWVEFCDTSERLRHWSEVFPCLLFSENAESGYTKIRPQLEVEVSICLMLQSLKISFVHLILHEVADVKGGREQKALVLPTFCSTLYTPAHQKGHHPGHSVALLWTETGD